MTLQDLQMEMTGVGHDGRTLPRTVVTGMKTKSQFLTLDQAAHGMHYIEPRLTTGTAPVNVAGGKTTQLSDGMKSLGGEDLFSLVLCNIEFRNNLL